MLQPLKYIPQGIYPCNLQQIIQPIGLKSKQQVKGLFRTEKQCHAHHQYEDDYSQSVGSFRQGRHTSTSIVDARPVYGRRFGCILYNCEVALGSTIETANILWSCAREAGIVAGSGCKNEGTEYEGAYHLGYILQTLTSRIEFKWSAHPAINIQFLSYINTYKMNICPCLQYCLDLFKNKNNQQVHLPKESEEEGLVSHTPDENTLSDNIKTTSHITKATPNTKTTNKNIIPSYFEEEDKSNAHLEEDLLNYKLQLQAAPANTKQTKKEQSRDIEDLIKEELEISPLEVIKTVEIQPEFKQEVFEQMREDVNPFSFNINLDPLDPYYVLIHDKTNKIGEYFSRQGAKIELTGPNNIDLQITAINNQNVNAFLMNYKLKSQYSFYLSTIKNDKLQHTFSNVLSDLRVIEALRPNLTRNLISFKRMGSFDARGCHYVKYQNGSKKQHWQIYLNDSKQDKNIDFKSCEVFCLKNIRQQSAKQLCISEYIQIDLQSINAGVMLNKLVNEYKTYLNNLQSYLQKNYDQQLV